MFQYFLFGSLAVMWQRLTCQRPARLPNSNFEKLIGIIYLSFEIRIPSIFGYVMFEVFCCHLAKGCLPTPKCRIVFYSDLEEAWGRGTAEAEAQEAIPTTGSQTRLTATRR